jgi:phosphoserine phosphatase
MESIGAFFDFDKTLLETESAKLGFQYLWERRMISFGFLLKILIANFFYQHHLVSDESDIPLLEMVGYPFAVEPTEPLRKVAFKRNWPILGFK